MKKILAPLLLIIIFGLSGCISSEQTQTDEKQPEIYVFDDVEKLDTLQNAPPGKPAVVLDTVSAPKPDSLATPAIVEDSAAVTNGYEYIVQVGAFSTKDRAEQFIKENQGRIDYQLKLSFSEQVHLHVVQLAPFNNRDEAEAARNKLWDIPVFKGAFIITKDN